MISPHIARLLLSVAVAVFLTSGAAAREQDLPPAAAGLPPGELLQLIDALEVSQAQDRLSLNEAQFARFLPRLRALQQARRRNEIERQRAIQDLNRMLMNEADEGAIKEKLRALQDLDSRAAAELKKAYDDVDQTLEPRQQARFRVFEQQIERRKMDLIAQARRQQPLPARGRINRPKN